MRKRGGEEAGRRGSEGVRKREGERTGKRENDAFIVNTRNKETFTNPGLGTDNSDPLEVSEVPLIRGI